MNKLDRIKEMETQLAALKAEVEQEQKIGFWEPKKGENYWTVAMDGVASGKQNVFQNCTEAEKAVYNIHQTSAQAKRAAELMRVSNAVTKACLQVDPDFVPDWSRHSGQDKCYALFNTEKQKWVASLSLGDRFVEAYVSTKEKAQQVADILNNEGVKPC